MTTLIRRKSPTESATLYKVGTVKVGNDGNKWKVSLTSNGVQRWKLFRKNLTRKISKRQTRRKK